MTANKLYIRSEKRNAASILSGGTFALGVSVGVFLLIFFYVVLSFFFESPDQSIIEISVSEVAVASISLVALLISFGTFSEQRMMRQAGTDPVVLAYLGQREDAPVMITFEIANVGAGAAMNVRFEFLNESAPTRNDRVVTDLSGEFVAIQVIRQNQRVQYNLGTAHTLIGDNPLPPMTVKILYEDIEGNEYSSIHCLDVREVSKQAAHTPPSMRRVNALEKIEKHLAKLTSHPELHIVAETQSEYESRMARRD
ncbi:hypothetical protein [Roseovarius mucosus]|uniref:hypothetical protein n=1 Tax=Roseovarius mucosus TaxID=215743 RepID=UPI003F6FD375